MIGIEVLAVNAQRDLPSINGATKPHCAFWCTRWRRARTSFPNQNESSIDAVVGSRGNKNRSPVSPLLTAFYRDQVSARYIHALSSHRAGSSPGRELATWRVFRGRPSPKRPVAASSRSVKSPGLRRAGSYVGRHAVTRRRSHAVAGYKRPPCRRGEIRLEGPF